MENAIFRDTAFPDIKLILDENSEYLGLKTPEGVEASTADTVLLAGGRVVSTHAEACRSIRRILTAQLGLDLPRGFAIELSPEDLAVFCTQLISVAEMDAYLEKKRARVSAAAARWLEERPWDTNPMTHAEARAHNFVFDGKTGAVSTDGCFNPGQTVELPSSVDGRRVTAVKGNAVVSYTYLDTLIIPDSVTYIEPYAFYDKVHLKNVYLSANLEVISEGVFARCRSLKSVVIPDSVKEICDEAFYHCSSLFSVIIPDSVERVGRCAFLNVPHIYYKGDAKGFPWGATVGN